MILPNKNSFLKEQQKKLLYQNVSDKILFCSIEPNNIRNSLRKYDNLLHFLSVKQQYQNDLDFNNIYKLTTIIKEFYIIYPNNIFQV